MSLLARLVLNDVLIARRQLLSLLRSRWKLVVFVGFFVGFSIMAWGSILALLTRYPDLMKDLPEVETYVVMAEGLVLLKTLGITNRKVVAEGPWESALPLPVPLRTVMLSRFIVVIGRMFLLVAITIGIMFITLSLADNILAGGEAAAVYDYRLVLFGPYFLVLVPLLTVQFVLAGILFTLAFSVRPFRSRYRWKAAAAVLAVGPVLFPLLVTFDLYLENPLYSPYIYFHLVVLGVLLLMVAASTTLVSQIWHNPRASGFPRFAAGTASRFSFPRTPRWQLVRKETATLLRDRDSVGVLLTAASMILVVLVSFFVVDPAEQITLREEERTDPAKIFFPFMLAFSMFLSTFFQCALLGMTRTGREGKQLWLLKTLPVESRLVIWSKALPLVILSLPVVVVMTIVFTILTEHTLLLSLVFIGMGLVMSIAFTAVGVLLGNLYPNFRQGGRGQPDLMGVLLLFGACAAISLPLMGFPGFFLLGQYTSGFLQVSDYSTAALMLLVEVGIAINVYLGAQWIASRSFERIPGESYL